MPRTRQATLSGSGDSEKFGDTPCRHDEQADGGNISVAVGHGLIADLHQSDDWDQSACEPQPANRKEGEFFCLRKSGKSQCGQEQDGPQDLWERPQSRVRIKDARLSGHIVLTIYIK